MTVYKTTVVNTYFKTVSEYFLHEKDAYKYVYQALFDFMEHRGRAEYGKPCYYDECLLNIWCTLKEQKKYTIDTDKTFKIEEVEVRERL